MADPFDKITANRHVIYPRYDPRNFVGREWLIDEAAKFRDDPDGRHLIIVGEPGGGKSSFLAYLAETWNCPLHFIRADNMGAVASTDPNSFLISLGAQLHEKYGPDIFDEGEVGKTTVTAGLTGGQAEVVGRFIKELRTPLPFLKPKSRDVQVRVGAAYGESRVVGEYIERMVIGSHALDALTLLHIAVLGPVKKIGELYPDEKVVILIDALDESLQHTGTQIIDVIPLVNDADFPPNLRLIMTSRPGSHLDRAGFLNEDRLNLEDKEKGYWQENRRDTSLYVTKRLQEPSFAEAIQSWPQQKVDAYVTRIMDSSDGNFLYLYFFFQELLESLRGGEKELDRVVVPKGLDEIYRNFAVAKIRGNVLGSIQFTAEGEITEHLQSAWRDIDGVSKVSVKEQDVTLTVEDSGKVIGRLFPLTLAAGVNINGLKISGTELGNWESIYVPVLGILAVAYEPLSVDKLAAFSNVKHVYVDTIVAQLKQFLDELNDGQAIRYRLYHTSFAEYLLDPGRNRDFHLDGPAYHYQVAAYYRGEHGSLADVDWELVEDNYPFDHLTKHLDASGRFDELHELVATGGKKLNWAEAHYRRSASYIGCVLGLDLAWSKVTGGTWEGIGKLFRYALVRSSFNALVGNIPSELLRELVRSEIWHPSIGLANAAQNMDEKDKADAIAKIAPWLSDGYREYALYAARRMADEQSRARVLFALAPQLPEELCLEAWEYGVKGFKAVLILDRKAINEERNKVLQTVAPYYTGTIAPQLPAEEAEKFLGGLFKSVLEIQSKEDRDLLLNTLLEHLPDDLADTAWAASFDIEDLQQRAVMLGALSNHLGPQRLTEALSHVGEFEDEKERAKGLQALAPSLTEESAETAFTIMNTILEPTAYAQTLGTFVRHLPDQTVQSEAWRCTVQTTGRVEFFGIFERVRELPIEVQYSVVQSALEVLRETPNPSTLTRLLYEQLSDLPENAHRNLIMTSLQSGQVIGDYAQYLGPVFFGVGGNARHSIHKLFELRTRVPELLSRLPTPEVRQRFAADVGGVISGFEQLVSELPSTFKSQLMSAANEADFDELLVGLAANGLTRHLPPPLQERSVVPALQIDDHYWRGLLLANLVETQEGEFQKKLFLVAVGELEEITDPAYMRNLLAKFSTCLPAKFAVPVISSAWRSTAPAGVDDAGLDQLVACVVTLPPALLERAVRLVDVSTQANSNLSNVDENSPGGQLTALIFRGWLTEGLIPEIYAHLLPEHRDHFLQVVFALQDESDLASVLTNIDAPLPEAWQQSAFDIASALTDPWQRTETLRSIAEHLGEALREKTLEAALAAARAVTKAGKSDVFRVTKTLLRTLSNPTAENSRWARAVALSLVAENLPPDERREVLNEALGLVRRIGDADLTLKLWCRLADHLSTERQEEFFEMLRQRAAENPKVWLTFFGMAHKVPDYLKDEALTSARRLSGNELAVSIFSRVASLLEAQHQEILVREAFALLPNLEVDRGWEQTRAIRWLAHLLPVDLQKEALLMSRKIDEGPRVQYLCNLTAHLSPDLVDSAIATCLEIADPEAQTTALCRLADHLPEPLKSEAAAKLEKVEERQAMAIGLAAIVGELPEEADPFAVEEKWAQLQAAANDPAAATEIEAELLANGRERLRGLFFMDRPALFGELQAFAPLLALGGPSLADEIFLASRDVAGWYP